MQFGGKNTHLMFGYFRMGDKVYYRVATEHFDFQADTYDSVLSRLGPGYRNPSKPFFDES